MKGPSKMSQTEKNLKNDLQPTRRRGRPTAESKLIRDPNYSIVSFEEGVSTTIGSLWLNRGTGKKPLVELDLERLPQTTGKIRAWLFPWSEKEGEAHSQ